MPRAVGNAASKHAMENFNGHWFAGDDDAILPGIKLNDNRKYPW